MPLLTLGTFTIPLIGGLLTFYTYSAQVNIINIISNNSGNSDWRNLLLLSLKPIIVFTSIFALQALSTTIGNILRNKMNAKVTLIFQSKIIDIANNIEFENFDDEEFCNKLQRAKNVVGEDLVGIMNFLIASISHAAELLSIIWLAATSGYPIIVIVVISMISINVYLRMSTEMKVRKLGREITYDGRVGDYLSNVLVEPNAIREMRIYNSIRYFLETWGTIITSQHRKRYDARRFEIKVGLLVAAIQTTSIFLVLRMLIGKITTSGSVTTGVIAVLFMALLSCGNKIMYLIWPLSKLYISGTKLYDLNEILKLESTPKKNNNSDENLEIDRITPIEISDMSFKYSKSTKVVLSNINLTIKKNEKIAIVGENGVGKSTLIKLILGQYKPTAGKITWNDKSYIPNKMSVVFQNFIRFELSLRENIALGNVEEFNNDKKIIEALKKCDLIELYTRLGSLDAKLGKLTEGGRQLSGGQWQKLAIARAIFNDAEFVVFDETTSAIDPNAEVEIFNKLMDICKEKTAIFISHRLGWARNAERVIVMDDGQVAEMGTHDDLMKLNGIYSKMYTLQSSWYR
jgi:ATP-binding cassette subfamily B protein